jgi:hypothetical protein
MHFELDINHISEANPFLSGILQSLNANQDCCPVGLKESRDLTDAFEFPAAIDGYS